MDVIYKTAESDEEIRDWVILHGGKPAIIDDPDVRMDEIGLRIDWPGEKDEGMLSSGREVTRDITWDEFFAIMNREDLVFMYSDEEDVNPTWRYKFAKRDTPVEDSAEE